MISDIDDVAIAMNELKKVNKQPHMADGVRFELTRDASPWRFSRPLQSTTLPTIQIKGTIMKEKNSSIELVRRTEVQKIIGLGASAIYDRMDKKSPRYDPTFPKPIKIGGGTNPPIRWVRSEIEDWLMGKIKERDNN